MPGSVSELPLAEDGISNRSPGSVPGTARPVGLAVQVLVTGGVEETAEPLRRLLGAA